MAQGRALIMPDEDARLAESHAYPTKQEGVVTVKSSRPATFFDHVKQALELFNDPAQLGERSPLATPYVLGETLHGTAATPLARGQALGALIERAAETLWGGPLPTDGEAMLAMATGEAAAAGRYDGLILELNYFKQRFRPAPRNQADVYSDFLHISRPTHDRHLRAAIEHLGAVLLQQLRPAIHLEQPAPPSMLVGRETLLAQTLSDLAAGHTVCLTGPGGVGKTALGATIAERRPLRFWYTFRPGLNDQLASLLFALGSFLHQNGASALWQQLIAERGRIAEGSLVLGLILSDLAELPTPPLLCFDEIDTLRPASQDHARIGHIQVIELLDSLRGRVPLLTIGQRALWAGASMYEVTTLDQAQFAVWLQSQQIAHTDADIAYLHTYTAGNLRLAELCLALYKASPDALLSDVLEQLPRSHALLPLWLRLERGLAPAELQLLQALSVFRSAAPADAWEVADSAQAAVLSRLIERRLVQHDDRGGVALLPALRTIVYTELPVEQREELHSAAAQIRAERGAYTAAAYHLAQAGQPEAAIDLWYAQRTNEIEQGQAASALAIFSQISPRRLAARQRKLLLLIRAELHALAGEPERVVADLTQEPWPEDDPATPEALLRLGQATDAQGRPEQALEIYRQGLDAVVALLHQGTQLHVQRSLTNMRQREVEHAWREANLARFNAEITLGIVNEQRGDYATASAHYTTALTIAEQFHYRAGIAQSHHYLAMLAGRRQDLETALPHFTQAISFYERVGDRVNREVVRSNLASAFIQVRQFAAALEPAEQALRFFSAMGNSARVAQNASNLAEAHAELNNLDQAGHYANLVLQQEEPQSHPYALYTLGTVARRRGDLKQAERSYDQSRRIAEMNDDSYLAAFAWRALGETALARGDNAQAEQCFAHALTLFQRLNLPDEIRETERLAIHDDASSAESEA